MKHCTWLLPVFVVLTLPVAAHHSGAQFDQNIQVNVSVEL